MGKRAKMDVCRLCGDHRPMTAEHVIPEAAGNVGDIYVYSTQALCKRMVNGEHFQNGMVQRSLCKPCNEIAGSRYVRALIDFTVQAEQYVPSIRAKDPISLPFMIRPLQVAKQLAMMTITMAQPSSICVEPYLALRHFAWFPYQSGGIRGMRFFAYLHFGGPVMEGMQAVIDTKGGPAPFTYCNVGKAPLGYIVTDDSARSLAWAKKLKLCDLTAFFFADFRQIAHVYLPLPPLNGERPFRSFGHSGPKTALAC